MGYFSPLRYFIKYFIRLFSKKYFLFILLFIFIFLLFIVFSGDVNAATLDGDYGVSQGISSSVLSNIDNAITNYKGNFDSFILRYWNNSYDIFFYNYNECGNLYLDSQTSSRITVRSQTRRGYTNNWVTLNSSGNYVSRSNLSDTVYMFINSPFALYTNRNIYTNSSLNTIYFQSTNNSIAIQPPFFITTDNELKTFDFDYLQIDGGTVPYYTEISEDIGANATLSLKYIYKGVTTDIDLTNYIVVNNNNTFDINIPYNVLTNNVIVRNGEEFSYIFTYKPFYR